MEVCNVHPFKVKEIPRYNMSDKYVGLLLITYNDKENLEKMLCSFEDTIDYPTVVHIIDMGSTDGTYELLLEWQKATTVSFLVDITIEHWYELEFLTKTMNQGFKHLISRQECEYIGWIHPDMVFEAGWLSHLVAVFQNDASIGKICSGNTRDGLPDSASIVPGHEQAYIIRRGVLLRVGLFDERFIGIGGWEDIDMARRIIQEGWRVCISSSSKVWHKGMATRERRDTSEEQIHNTNEYRKKWGDNKHGEIFV